MLKRLVLPNLNVDIRTYFKDTPPQLLVVEDASTLTEAELNTYLIYLKENAYPCRLVLKRLNQDLVKFQKIFDNLYLHNNRSKFSKISEQQLQTLKDKNKSKIRTEKQNLIDGVSSNVSLQQQQQRKQQHEMKQEVQGEARKVKVIESQVKLDVPIVRDAHHNIQHINDPVLITRENIEQQLGAFAPGVNVKEIWDRLVGAHANEISNINTKITHVEKRAMELIIKNYEAFSYGLVLDNLPNGFFDKVENDQHVLRFNEELAAAMEGEDNPLRLTLDTDYDECIGDEKQFEFMLSTVEVDKKIFNRLLGKTARDVWTSKDKEAFENLLKALSTSQALQAEITTKLFSKDKPFSEFKKHHLRGITKILLTQGPQAVQLFLTMMETLVKENLYEDFKADFLDKTDNYERFMTEKGVELLNKLTNLSVGEREWWSSLIKQHLTHNKQADFCELFSAFDFFANEMKRYTEGRDLPTPCPIRNIRNMKTALDRLLYMMRKNATRNRVSYVSTSAYDRKATFKAEQLYHLDELDLGPEGAYYALRYEGYYFATRKAEFNYKPDVIYDLKHKVKKHANYFKHDHIEDEAYLISEGDALYRSAHNSLTQKYAPHDYRILFAGNGNLFFYRGIYEGKDIIIMRSVVPSTHTTGANNVTLWMLDKNWELKDAITWHDISSPPLTEATDNTAPNRLMYPDIFNALDNFIVFEKTEIDQAKKYFSRYIAKERTAFHYNYYEILLKEISDCPSIDDTPKKYLIYFLAKTLTGGKLQITENVEEEFHRLLNNTSELFKRKSPDCLDHLFNIIKTGEFTISDLNKFITIMLSYDNVADLNKVPGSIIKIIRQTDDVVIRKILDNCLARLHVKNKLKDRTKISIPNINSLAEFLSISREMNRKNVNQNARFFSSMAYLLSIVDDEGMPNNESAMHDGGRVDAYFNNFKNLMTALGRLEIEFSAKDVIFKMLENINFEKSRCLPSFDQLTTVFMEVNNDLSTLLKRLDPELMDKKGMAQHAADSIQERLHALGVTFGNVPIKTSQMGLLSLLRSYLRFKPAELNKVFDKLKTFVIGDDSISKLAKIKEMIAELQRLVFAEEANLDKILENLQELDDALHFFANEHTLLMSVSSRFASLFDLFNEGKAKDKKNENKNENEQAKILKAAKKADREENIKKQKEEFLKKFMDYHDSPDAKKTALIFIKKYLELDYEHEISMKLFSLHLTAEGDILQPCLDYLGKLDIISMNRQVKVSDQEMIEKNWVSIRDSLNQYHLRFEKVKSFINALIEIKNENEKSFRAICQSVMRHSQIDFEARMLLLANLQQCTSVSIDKLFAHACEVISKANSCTPLNLIKAINQLIELEIIAKHLDADQFTKLFEASFTFNLQHDEIYPLAEISHLLKISSQHETIPPERMFQLFNNTIPLILANKTNTVTTISQTITTYVKEAPEIVDVITILLAIYNETTDETKDAGLSAFLTELNMFEDKKTLQKILKIMVGLSLDEKGKLLRDKDKKPIVSMDKLWGLYTGLTDIAREDGLLDSMLNLFNYSPKPQLDKFEQILQADNKQTIIQAFDLDPTGRRAYRQRKNGAWKKPEDILNKQFSNDRVKPILSEMKDMLQGIPLAQDERVLIARQFAYINAIGYKHKIKPSTGGDAKPLIHFSRDELTALAGSLVEFIRNQAATAASKETARLQLLAVIREMIFRTTGRQPRSTQIISVLLSLRYTNNLFMQINTGEGKGMTTAMLAAMRWAEEKTVDVCTANQDLAKRDFNGFKNFFALLGADATYLEQNSPDNTYVVGGINYTTISDLSFYRANAKLRHEDLNVRKRDNKKLATTLLIDESDDVTLDSKIPFNVPLPHDGSNPFAWIYYEINEFIDSDDFIKAGWLEDADVRELKTILQDKIQDQEKIDLLSKISKEQFGKWIDAACKAKGREEDIHYQILSRFDEKTNAPVKLAVPMDDAGVPQIGSSFADGVHQFLHARLNKKARDAGQAATFPVEIETDVFATEMAKNLVGHYAKTGDLIGISGTLGASRELQYLQSNYGNVALSIPPHKKNNREPFKPTIVAAKKAYTNAIKTAIKGVTRKKTATQPILIVCKDAAKAKKMLSTLTGLTTDEFKAAHAIFQTLANLPEGESYAVENNTASLFRKLKKNIYKNDKDLCRYLDQLLSRNRFHSTASTKQVFDDISKGNYKRGFNYQLVVGDETNEEREEKIKRAGKDNTITIATPLLGRGTNIEPTHKEGLFVIQTFLDALRLTWQIIGRCARNGKVGKYLAIFEKNEIVYEHAVDLSKYKGKAREKKIEEIQAKMEEELAIERFYSQEVDGIKNVFLKQLNKWHQFLLSLQPENTRVKRQNELLLIQSLFLKEMNTEWEGLLKASSLEGNPYIRRSEKGLETAALEKCITDFELKVVEMWEGWLQASSQYSEIKTIQKKDISGFDALRYRYLLEISIEEKLAARKIHYQPEANGSALKSKDALSLNEVDYALDEDAAYVAFSEKLQQVPEDKSHYVLSSAFFKLKLIREELETLVNKARLNDEKDEKGVTQSTKTMLKTQLIGLETQLNASPPTVDDVNTAFKTTAEIITRYNTHCYNVMDKAAIQPTVINFLVTLQSVESQVTADDAFNKNVEANVEAFTNTADNHEFIIAKLQASLAWAAKKGWDYKLERAIVCNAAAEILNAIDTYNKSKTNPNLYQLYKTLEKHRANLANTWVVAWGHHNTYVSIRQALHALDHISKISKKLPVEACQKAKEEVFVGNLLVRFWDKYEEFKQLAQDDKKGWRLFSKEKLTHEAMDQIVAIQKDIDPIIDQEQTALAVQTVQSYFMAYHKKGSNDARFNNKLKTLINETKQVLKSVSNNASIQKHDDLSAFVKLKGDDFKRQMAGSKFNQVSLQLKQKGFQDPYLEVVIECDAGEYEAFEALGFEQINPKKQDKIKKLEDDESSIKKTKLSFQQKKEKTEQLIKFLDQATSGQLSDTTISHEFVSIIEAQKQIEHGKKLDKIPMCLKGYDDILTKLDSSDSSISNTELDRCLEFSQSDRKEILSFEKSKKTLEEEEQRLQKEISAIPSEIQNKIQDIIKLNKDKEELENKLAKAKKEKPTYIPLFGFTKETIEKHGSEKDAHKKLNEINEEIKILEENIKALNKKINTDGLNKQQKQYVDRLLKNQQEQTLNNNKLEKIKGIIRTAMDSALKKEKSKLLGDMKSTLDSYRSIEATNDFGSKILEIDKGLTFLGKKKSSLEKKKPILVKHFNNVNELIQFEQRLKRENVNQSKQKLQEQKDQTQNQSIASSRQSASTDQ